MSRKQIYAWCSLGFALGILAYYLISVFGLPAGMENYSGRITGLLWRVIGISLVVEFVLDLLNSTGWGGVQKDERDVLIESKGFRNTYYFVTIALLSLVVHLLVSDFLSENSGEAMFLSQPFMTVHVLVVILLVTVVVKSSTQLYLYQRESV